MSKNLLRSALTVTALGIVTRGLSFLFRIYLSRKIGAENLGVYQIALSVFFLFATLSSGLPLTLSRKTAQLQALNRSNEYKSYMSATLILGVGISFAITLLLYAFAPHLDFLFSDDRCKGLFLLLIPSCISTSIYGIVRGWFWGNRKYEVFAFTEFFECVVRILLGVLFVSGIIDGLGGAKGTAISFTISDYFCTGLIALLFFVFGGRLAKPREYGKIVKTALPLTAVRLYNSLINSLIAIIVPSILISIGLSKGEAMGEYGRMMGMALPLVLTPTMLTGALNTVLVPEIASLNAKGDKENLVKKIKGSLSICVFCALAFTVIFIPLGEKIGTFFYDDPTSGRYVSVASTMIVSVVLSGVTSTIMDSLGLEVKTMKNFIISSLFLVGSLVIASRFIGVYAIIVSYLISYGVTTILNLKAIKKALKINYKGLFSSSIIQSIISIIATFGVSFVTRLTNSLPLILNIVIPSIFGVAFFVIANIALGEIDLSGFVSKNKKSVKKPT